MSLVLEILEALYDTNLSYKGVRVNVFGITRLNGSKRSVFGNTIAKLNKKGFIKNNGEVWSITNSGRNYFHKDRIIFKDFQSPFDKKSPRNLVLMFDIPESKKVERGWLRQQLKEFNYIMIQRSVWVGPSPLPKDFKTYLKEVGIKDCIKFFKLAKPYRPN